MDKQKEIEEALEIGPIEASGKIVEFIREKVRISGAEGLVLGLSGGLDSCTAASLCAEALEKDKVLAIFMPEEGVTDPENATDAEKVAENLGIKLKEIPISSILQKVKKNIDFSESAKIAYANLKARTRMIILYYYANLLDYLVVGSSNKSELRCGYFTKYGDGAADLLPIGSLYKTQVREVARGMGVPQNIIDKTPTAGLWKGQKDEEELGLPYDKIDRIYAGLDADLDLGEIAEASDVEVSKVRDFREREERSRHKLRRPPTPSI